MRKSSTTTAAARAGAKPSAKTGDDDNQKRPQTGPQSTQTPKQPDAGVQDPPGDDNGSEADIGDDGAHSHSNGTGADTEKYRDLVTGAVDVIRSMPPELAAAALGAAAPAVAPAQLGKQDKARLRNHVRAAAGRLAAANKDARDAKSAWDREVSEARDQGYPELMIQAQALDGGLTPEDVPAIEGN